MRLHRSGRGLIGRFLVEESGDRLQECCRLARHRATTRRDAEGKARAHSARGDFSGPVTSRACAPSIRDAKGRFPIRIGKPEPYFDEIPSSFRNSASAVAADTFSNSMELRSRASAPNTRGLECTRLCAPQTNVMSAFRERWASALPTPCVIGSAYSAAIPTSGPQQVASATSSGFSGGLSVLTRIRNSSVPIEALAPSNPYS